MAPDELQWNEDAVRTWLEVRHDLQEYAKSKGLTANSLGSTAIVVIFSRRHILATHIGDGRAAYRNDQGEWKAIMVPVKGEEANQTVFLTSLTPKNHSTFPFESRVISDRITGFALMSDGCERAAFECLIKGADGKMMDPNLPYPRFFEPLVSQLRKNKRAGMSTDDLHDKWQTFIEKGNNVLASEIDDKTMILGVLNKSDAIHTTPER
jgi:hypothetical protein